MHLRAPTPTMQPTQTATGENNMLSFAFLCVGFLFVFPLTQHDCMKCGCHLQLHSYQQWSCQRRVMMEMQAATSAPWTGLSEHPGRLPPAAVGGKIAMKKLHAFVLSICAYTWSHVRMFLCLWARLYLCFFFLYRRNAMCVSLPLTPYFFHVMAPPQECE